MYGSSKTGAYSAAPGERGVDGQTYNPHADAGTDNAAFDPDFDSEDMHPVGARGAGNQPTGVNFEKEDADAEQSERTGKISKGEVEDLLSSATDEERGASGRTRGVKNDPYKQERQLDQSFVDAGIVDTEQDVEITAATGRGGY